MPKSRSARDALWLALLLLALGAVMAAWVSLDRRPPEWDHANHLERALECHRILAEPGHDRLDEITAKSSFYPPVVLCAAGLAYFVLPASALTAQAVIWMFLVVGALAVWGLGRRLLDPAAGLLAAFCFVTAPFVVFSLLRFQLDLPLAAVVAVALYALVRAEAFQSAGWSLALGVVLGLGMLVKPPFAAYLLPPLAWAAWLALRAPDRGTRLRHLSFALLVGGLIALPWYGPRLAGLPMQILNRSFKQAIESPPTLSWPGLLFYPRVFLSLVGVLVGLAALAGVWAVRRMPRARGLVWAALAPWVIFVFIQNKNLRYALPLVPVVCLAASAGITALGPRLRSAATATCVVLGLLQVSGAAFGLPPFPHPRALLIPLVMADPPDASDWRHGDVLAAVLRETKGQPARVAVVPNDNYFSISNFRYEVMRERLPLRLMRAWNAAPFGVDVAIVKTGDQGPDAASEEPDRIMRALGGGDPWLAAAYPVVAEFPLPDGSRAMVRVRRPPPVTALSAEALAARIAPAAAEFLAEFAREPHGLTVRTEHRPEALLRGEVDRVVVEVDSALVGEHARGRPPLRIHDVRLVGRGLRFNPRRLAEAGRLEVLDLEGITAERLRVNEADLLAFVRAQRGLSRASLTLGEGEARVTAGLGGSGPEVMGRIRLFPGFGGAPFALEIDEVRLGGVPLPDLLAGWIVRHFDPTARLSRLPLAVAFGPLRIIPGRLEITGPPTGGPTR